jgi:hypothetical protein
MAVSTYGPSHDPSLASYTHSYLPSQIRRLYPRPLRNWLPQTGISNFGTIIIKGFGFSTLVTALMQIPYGAIIAISILICVFANEYVEKIGCQARSWFILLFLAPNIAGAFGLAYLDADNQAGRLVSYYLTGPYNAAFVMVLSMSTANTAGHTKKVVTNG